MNTRKIRIVLLSAALAVGVVGITGEQAVSKSKGAPVKAVPFTMTTVYSGPLSGEIVVDGQSVFINDKTSFHKVGVGPVDSGQSVNSTAIFIGGVMKGKKAIATMVLIGEPESSADFSAATVDGSESTSGAR
jgi:hypothetical protein